MTDLESLKLGFLQQIIADPWDDWIRREFADCLEEKGDEQDCQRAEFIRVQYRIEEMKRKYDPISPLPPEHHAHSEWKSLRRREQELLDRAAAEDWSAFPSYVDRWQWRRGFVEVVQCRPQAWLERGAAILEAHPVLTVVFPITAERLIGTVIERQQGELAEDFDRRLCCAASVATKGPSRSAIWCGREPIGTLVESSLPGDETEVLLVGHRGTFALARYLFGSVHVARDWSVQLPDNSSLRFQAMLTRLEMEEQEYRFPGLRLFMRSAIRYPEADFSPTIDVPAGEAV